MNIIICRSANLSDFLRGVQYHIFEHGVFQFCLSDLGSQIKAGAGLVESFLSDFETKLFLESHGIEKISFHQYAKGNSSLGSLIECIVKQVKRLIFKSIGNYVLEYFNFEFLIKKAVHLINKRPIAFKDGLRTLSKDELPYAISPEILIKGFETPSLSVIPDFHQIDDNFDPLRVSFGQEFSKLVKVRQNLIEQYHGEFLATLIHQAVDKDSRYKPIPHSPMKEGDIVLLVDPHLKQSQYPMGRVKSVEINSLGETTGAHVFKGTTRETVYRHATSLILLLSGCGELEKYSPVEKTEISSPLISPKRPKRAAASSCKKWLEALTNDKLI